MDNDLGRRGQQQTTSRLLPKSTPPLLLSSSCFRGCCVTPIAGGKMSFQMARDLFVDAKNPSSKTAIKMFQSDQSDVYLSKIDAKPVAIKLPKLRTKTDIDRYHAELRIVSSLKHANVCQLVGAQSVATEYALVFPWCENGSGTQAMTGTDGYQT